MKPIDSHASVCMGNLVNSTVQMMSLLSKMRHGLKFSRQNFLERNRKSKKIENKTFLNFCDNKKTNQLSSVGLNAWNLS